MRDFRKHFVDGAWVDPLGGEVHEVVNPATETLAGQIVLGTSGDVDRAVDAARRAFATFSRTSREDRLELLNAILGGFAARQADLAEALVEELGAPAKFASEMQVGSGLMHLMTTIEALKGYAFERPASDRTTVRLEPIGVVGMITPWNWPINQVMCKVAPAIATGNTMVHKPSEVTPFTSHIIAEIMHEAGLPAGVYNLVDGSGPVVGAAISAHPGIAMVSFTGSTGAGIDVAQRAAATVKRVHQELGGKSPNLVLEGADFQQAVGENVHRLLMNSGQTCHAPTRLLVPRARMEEAKAIAAHVVATLPVGDPQTEVYLGPVVSERQWTRIQSLIQNGIDEGATLVVGGTGRPEGLDKGFYVRPTVFGDVSNSMTIAREEIFGPVLCIIGYDDLEEAISVANDTPYGLAAYVQAGSDDEAAEVALRIEAGMIYINGGGEDFAAPFGGYKASGNGREWGEAAFADYLEIKALIHKAAA